uniref:Zinc finger protein 268 n=1 Tax=Neovison vison TaxID=452646 RepID=A0A8C7ACN6_NEOVI
MATRVRTAAVWKKSRKLIVWNGIRRIKASWKVRQKATNVRHLGNCTFLVQIMFLQDKTFINTSHVEVL